ncbi:MAG: hypothetical protein NT080_10565 [Spirochaetes bacterium]|nr:hypothetical protein [Spirochaetota bacterium]
MSFLPRRLLGALLAVSCLGPFLAAQDAAPPAEASPGGEEAPAPGETTIDDDMFSDAPDDVVAEVPTGTVLDELERGKLLAWSGSVSARALASAGWETVPWNGGALDGFTAGGGGSFASTLAFDVRPDGITRVHGAFTTEYPDFVPYAKELFLDYDLASVVYFRAGRQVLSWGAGRFFKDGNLVADSEEGAAVKAGVPVGRLGLSFVAIDRPAWHSGEAALREIAVGLMSDIAFGTTEFSLGGLYRAVEGGKAVATVKSSLWGFDLYGDAVLRLSTSYEPAYAALGGFYWDHVDPSIRLAGEYRFASSDFVDPGHAIALAVLFRKLGGSSVDAGVRWDHDFGSASGQVTPGLSLSPWRRVDVVIGLPFAYGSDMVIEYGDEEDPELFPGSAAVIIAVTVTVKF